MMGLGDHRNICSKAGDNARPDKGFRWLLLRKARADSARHPDRGLRNALLIWAPKGRTKTRDRAANALSGLVCMFVGAF